MNCVVERRPPVPDIDDEVKALRVIYEICRQLDLPTGWTMTVGDR
jgi:hypothetical protein